MDKLKAAGMFMFGPLGKAALRDIGVASEEDKKWLVYNYPAYLKLIHYDTSDVVNPVLRIVKMLQINVFLVYTIEFVNLINCIIQISSDCDKVHYRFIIYSIVSK